MERKTLSSLVLAFAAAALSSMPAASQSNEIVTRADVEFIALNPLRGDLSPKSGKLWGDIREDVSAGSLVTFLDGFQSPPHIHNITYRAVVISGEIHNDDPDAAKFWMEPGSFWTQPAGEVHITAAQGESPTIFLEILSGPYLVQPAEEEFDIGERPINIEARNIVWLDAADAAWVSQSDDAGSGAEMAFLWGKVQDDEKNGTFIKLPSGYNGEIRSDAPLLRAVTIQGKSTVQMFGEAEVHSLDPGSYFSSKGEAAHKVTCESGEDCILYMHTEGKYQLVSS
ncbi:MAG: DUF4437 domain-containing protein [Pseudomonadota bacterium]